MTMFEPSSFDSKPAVFVPMDMSLAETLLKEAKAVLDEFGVVFFLRHGTCLGAVRDGAFIRCSTGSGHGAARADGTTKHQDASSTSNVHGRMRRALT